MVVPVAVTVTTAAAVAAVIREGAAELAGAPAVGARALLLGVARRRAGGEHDVAAATPAEAAAGAGRAVGAAAAAAARERVEVREGHLLALLLLGRFGGGAEVREIGLGFLGSLA